MGKPVDKPYPDAYFGLVGLMVRKANGLETVAGAESLTGPVEPLRSGVEEPCLICGETKSVPIDAPEHPDEPWSRKIVGHEPCPNCSSDSTQNADGDGEQC